MNERIQELAEQAGFSVVETQGTGETTLWAFDDEPIDDELQKFAELIIQECIDACIEADGIKYITPPSQGQVVFDCVREIKQRWS